MRACSITMNCHVLLCALVFVVIGRIRIALAIDATIAHDQLSSTHTNREQVCPGETVLYRCSTTNGSFIAWTLPPLVDTSNPIVFESTDMTESVRTRIQGEVLALLVTKTPVFESFLVIKSSVNVPFINVTCTLGGSNTQLSTVYSIATKPSNVTGIKVVLNTIFWTAPSMPVGLEFYELHAIGRNASFENRVFHVLETFLSINITSFSAVNITVQNRCGQRSEAVPITLKMAPSSCDMTDSATQVASTVAAVFFGVLLTSLSGSI